MKNIIKEILISQLSFPLKYKNEKEIWWEGKWSEPITVEIIDIEDEQYIIRRYYGNGQLCYKENYRQGQPHGEQLEWYDNGQLYNKINYHQGLYHGEYLGWWNNGQLWFVDNYHKGQLHGKYLEWYENGQLRYKKEYNYGKLINEEYY